MATDRPEDLLSRVKRSLGLGDDPVSRALLYRLLDEARRLDPSARMPDPPPLARKVTLTGIVIDEPVAKSRKRPGAIQTIAAVLGILFFWPASVAMHAAVGLLLFGTFLRPAPSNEPITVGVGSSEVGVMLDLQGPEEDDEQVEADQETPDETATEDQPLVETATPEPENPQPEPPSEEEIPEQPVDGTPQGQYASAETMTTEELQALVDQAVLGLGASAQGPAGLPPEIGRTAQTNPTAATQAARREELASLAGGRAQAIVVVRGEHDNVSGVLDALNIRHVDVDPDDLPTLDLSDTRVLIVNCSNLWNRNRWEGVDGDERRLGDLMTRLEDVAAELRGSPSRVRRYELERLRGDLVRRIDGAMAVRKAREFVESGGYLFTTDWAVTLVEHAFPGTLTVGGDVAQMARVPIRACPGAGTHPLLRKTGLDDASRATTTSGWVLAWRVADGSYRFGMNMRRVEALVDAPDRGPGVIAATFRWSGAGTGHEGGRVLHVQSHFDSQQAATGEFALQNVLVNFVLEAYGQLH